MNLSNCPNHSAVQVIVDVIQFFHKANLVSISCKEGYEFLIVHAGENCTFTDLEAIHVQYWQDGS